MNHVLAQPPPCSNGLQSQTGHIIYIQYWKQVSGNSYHEIEITLLIYYFFLLKIPWRELGFIFKYGCIQNQSIPIRLHKIQVYHSSEFPTSVQKKTCNTVAIQAILQLTQSSHC